MTLPHFAESLNAGYLPEGYVSCLQISISNQVPIIQNNKSAKGYTNTQRFMSVMIGGCTHFR